MDLKYEPGLADRPRDAETGMPFSPMVERIAGAGSRAWRVHDRAAQLAHEGRDAIMLTVGDPDRQTTEEDVAVSRERWFQDGVAPEEVRLTFDSYGPGDLLLQPSDAAKQRRLTRPVGSEKAD